MTTPQHFFKAVAVLATAALALTSQTTPREQPGLIAGGYLLNSGWRVRPAGQQVPLDTLPMACILSSDRKFLIVLNGGYNPPSLSVLDSTTGREVQRVPVADAWLGLALSPNGKTLWVGGGSKASIF